MPLRAFRIVKLRSGVAHLLRQIRGRKVILERRKHDPPLQGVVLFENVSQWGQFELFAR